MLYDFAWKPASLDNGVRLSSVLAAMFEVGSACIRRDNYLAYSLSCPSGNATARDQGLNRQDFRELRQIRKLFDITSQGLKIL